MPRPILRVGLGWMLMLAGMFLVLDAGTAVRSRGETLSAFEALGGFALAVAGLLLRRSAVTRTDGPN